MYLKFKHEQQLSHGCPKRRSGLYFEGFWFVSVPVLYQDCMNNSGKGGEKQDRH